MRGILDLLRRSTREHKTPAPPLLADYRVGIVVSHLGVNGRQLAEISNRINFIGSTIEKGGPIYVYVPGFNMNDAEESVPRDLRNMLERKRSVQVTYVPTRGDHKAGVAMSIHNDLVRARRCDEVWCCPAPGQTAGSIARVAQVYKLAEGSPRFKLIPHWVEPAQAAPKSKQVKPATKGGQKWPKQKSSYR